MKKVLSAEDLLNIPDGSRRGGWLVIEGDDSVRIPCIGLKGSQPGPRILVIGAQHGDECFGILGAIRAIGGIDPQALAGEVWAVPVLNLLAYHAGDRVNPFDRQDMNRVHPGNPKGSYTEQLAHMLHAQLLPHVDLVIDLHGGSAELGDIPFARWTEGAEADQYDISMQDLCKNLGVKYLVRPDNQDRPGLLSGDPDVFKLGLISIEAGSARGSSCLHGQEMADYVLRALVHMEMLPRKSAPSPREPVQYVEVLAERSSVAGLFTSAVDLGKHVNAGDRIGSIQDFFGRNIAQYHAPQSGVVLVLRTGVRTVPDMLMYCLGILE